MPETIDHDAHAAEPSLQARAGWIMRRVAAIALAVVGFVVTLAAAGVLLVAAIAIAVIIAAGVAVMWLLGRLSVSRRDARRTPRTLEAQKGPQGWTVDVRHYSF